MLVARQRNGVRDTTACSPKTQQKMENYLARIAETDRECAVAEYPEHPDSCEMSKFGLEKALGSRKDHRRWG